MIGGVYDWSSACSIRCADVSAGFCWNCYTFEVEASCIAVQYRKMIRRPAVKAELILDGDVENPILLDSNFDENWGDCLYLQPILHHGINKKHTVEIMVQDTETKEKTPFYLMSLIVA